MVDGGGWEAAQFGRKSSEASRLLGIIPPGGQIPVLLLIRAFWRRVLAAEDDGGGVSARCSTE
jgi:hypothetical protein